MNGQKKQCTHLYINYSAIIWDIFDFPVLYLKNAGEVCQRSPTMMGHIHGVTLIRPWTRMESGWRTLFSEWWYLMKSPLSSGIICQWQIQRIHAPGTTELEGLSVWVDTSVWQNTIYVGWVFGWVVWCGWGRLPSVWRHHLMASHKGLVHKTGSQSQVWFLGMFSKHSWRKDFPWPKVPVWPSNPDMQGISCCQTHVFWSSWHNALD
jgi:hypothetical protein